MAQVVAKKHDLLWYFSQLDPDNSGLDYHADDNPNPDPNRRLDLDGGVGPGYGRRAEPQGVTAAPTKFPHLTDPSSDLIIIIPAGGMERLPGRSGAATGWLGQLRSVTLVLFLPLTLTVPFRTDSVGATASHLPLCRTPNGKPRRVRPSPRLP